GVDDAARLLLAVGEPAERVVALQRPADRAAHGSVGLEELAPAAVDVELRRTVRVVELDDLTERVEVPARRDGVGARRGVLVARHASEPTHAIVREVRMLDASEVLEGRAREEPAGCRDVAELLHAELR